MEKVGVLAVFSLVLLAVLLSGCAQQAPPASAGNGDAGSGTAPQITDACAAKTCSNFCAGTTLYKSTGCADGECQYSLDYASEECGYVQQVESKFSLDVNLRVCEYDADFDKFGLFFTIKNLGQNSPPQDSSVWLIGEGITSKACAQIQDDYGFNQILWGDKQWTGSYPYQGNLWEIKNKPDFESIEYKLVYCENVNCLAPPGSCTEQNGEVWHEGSTAGCTVRG